MKNEAQTIDASLEQAAQKRGSQAAKQRKRRAPLMDPKFIKSLPDTEPGGSSPYFKAWLKGYDMERSKTEQIDISEDVSKDINIEYKQLMKQDIKQIKATYSASHKVSDTRGLSKADLVTDILRAKYGKKKVDAAFGLSETVQARSWHRRLSERQYNTRSASKTRISKVNQKQPMIFEAKQWAKIMKAIRSSSGSGPWTLVAIKNGKVVGQSLVKILTAIPAHYEDLMDKHPGARIAIENESGQIVYGETYSPSEYPQQRDPFRSQGTAHTSSQHVKPAGVKHKPLGRKRARLKETSMKYPHSKKRLQELAGVKMNEASPNEGTSPGLWVYVAFYETQPPHKSRTVMQNISKLFASLNMGKADPFLAPDGRAASKKFAAKHHGAVGLNHYKPHPKTSESQIKRAAETAKKMLRDAGMEPAVELMELK